MISTSFKPFAEIFVFPIIWIPKAPTLNNYEQVFAVSEYVNFFRGFGNTLLVVVPTMFCGVFMSALAAFGYSKINFPGRDRIFFAYIATMAIPGIITLVPNYIIFTKIGLLDSRLSLMLPGMFGSASAVFFIRQFMRGLPKDLDDAARVDGMNWFGIFLKILLPLSKPVIITILLFSFIGGYNDYMAPLLYIRSADKYTLQLTLSAMNDTFGTRWGVVMAGSCIAMIPTIIIFFLAQRFFIEGISLTGIKE
jgi:multiple sugar transport system permease protein